MNRNAAYRVVLALLIVCMLTSILYPIHGAPITTRSLEAPADCEPRHRRPGLTSCAPEWNQTYGGPNGDSAYSVVETGDGGYAIAGSTGSFGAGGWDFWLVKTDAAGNMEWNQTYGGTDHDEARSVVETSDGGYALAGITCSFDVAGGDFWLVKTDSAGNALWNQTYGGTNWDWAWSVVETGDGGYALAGSTWSFGAGSADFWLVKTDSAGNMEWNQTYGGPDDELGNSVVGTSDGGYALAGWTESLGAGSADFWLVKTDSAGNMEWNQTYGGSSYDHGYSVVVTEDGGYAIAGLTNSFGAGGHDAWLVKTDSAGNASWTQTYGGTSDDDAYSVVETGDGGYAIAGHTNSFGAGASDFWLVKTDSAGNMEWNQTYGGPDEEGARSVVQTSDGGYALAGNTGGYPNYDFWLVKTEPDKGLWISTCNEAGHGKTVFNFTESVYVLGGNFPTEVNITIFIIPDNRSALPSNAVSKCWEITNSNGELPLTLAWEDVSIEGDYDLWVDVNQNGVYDETIDIYHHSALDIYAFVVIPEFPSFLILPLFMIATLLAAILYRREHPATLT